jgi:hypothetical protein
VFIVLRRRAMLRQRQSRFALPSATPQHWS